MGCFINGKNSTDYKTDKGLSVKILLAVNVSSINSFTLG